MPQMLPVAAQLDRGKHIDQSSVSKSNCLASLSSSTMTVRTCVLLAGFQIHKNVGNGLKKRGVHVDKQLLQDCGCCSFSTAVTADIACMEASTSLHQNFISERLLKRPAVGGAVPLLLVFA